LLFAGNDQGTNRGFEDAWSNPYYNKNINQVRDNYHIHIDPKKLGRKNIERLVELKVKYDECLNKAMGNCF